MDDGSGELQDGTLTHIAITDQRNRLKDGKPIVAKEVVEKCVLDPRVVPVHTEVPAWLVHTSHDKIEGTEREPLAIQPFKDASDGTFLEVGTN